MRDTQSLGEGTDQLVVRSTTLWRFNNLRPQDDVLVAATCVDVVVLKKHCRWQHDIGHGCSLGHELLMDTDE